MGFGRLRSKAICLQKEQRQVFEDLMNSLWGRADTEEIRGVDEASTPSGKHRGPAASIFGSGVMTPLPDFSVFRPLLYTEV
jgi:hypothetical protein